jgi:hypothetical protein
LICPDAGLRAFRAQVALDLAAFADGPDADAIPKLLMLLIVLLFSRFCNFALVLVLM